MLEGDSEASAMQALERFVCENDDLSELEERIGRFNIFDALGIARAEIRHSNFLAWLLDPNESHGQGALFLKALLMDLLRQTPVEKRPLSPVELDGEELSGVEIRREWKHIDLLILCKEPAFAIAIENKVYSGEHGDQLERYEREVRGSFPERKHLFVFLTPDGTAPSDDEWIRSSYANIHRVIERCRRTNGAGLGADVAAFVDHYLRLIGSRFMDDATLDDLCRRIYRKHRQAIDLIIERGTEFSLLPEFERWLERLPSSWYVRGGWSKGIGFAPTAWKSLFPPIRSDRWALPDKTDWLHLSFRWEPGRCSFQVKLCPTDDSVIRTRVRERLIGNPKEFGLRLKKKTDQWNLLCDEELFSWPPDGSPDLEQLALAVTRKLEELVPRFDRVTEELRPVLTEGKPGTL